MHQHQIEVEGPTQATPRPYINRPYSLRPQKTSPIAWIMAICCAITWAAIILGGITFLVLYLLFRPKSPRIHISGATLNGAYLDNGKLLNADITILANFSNPNRKIDVTFRYIALDLYYNRTLIATQGGEGFSEEAGEATLRSIHMVVSQVELPMDIVQEWTNEVGQNDIKLEVRGSFLTTLNFVGTFLKITYVLHGHCHMRVSGPPTGVLLSTSCTTKR